MPNFCDATMHYLRCFLNRVLHSKPIKSHEKYRYCSFCTSPLIQSLIDAYFVCKGRTRRLYKKCIHEFSTVLWSNSMESFFGRYRSNRLRAPQRQDIGVSSKDVNRSNRQEPISRDPCARLENKAWAEWVLFSVQCIRH